MRIIACYLIIFLLNSAAFSQENIQLNRIMKVFEEFEYSETIRLVDSLLIDKNISQSVKNELLLIKAISHYSLSQETLTRKCFIEMLKNDSNLQLDSNRVSPKILTLFLSVKDEFHELVTKQAEQKEDQKKTPLLSDSEIKNITNRYDNYNDAIYKSIILPGWGHYSLDYSVKGIILSAASLVNLGGIIFYSFDARSKEKNYLGSIEAEQIKTAYTSYNKSYNIRNILIGSFITIWLYSQIDLLLARKAETVSETSIMMVTFAFENKNKYLNFSFPIF